MHRATKSVKIVTRMIPLKPAGDCAIVVDDDCSLSYSTFADIIERARVGERQWKENL